MQADIFMQDDIIFTPDTHQYYNRKKEEYSSVTRMLGDMQVPFDREGISRRMAISLAEDSGISIEQAQREILQDWEEKRSSSEDKGNYIHDGLEYYTHTGKINEGIEKPVAYIQGILKQYYRFYSEVFLYSHKYRIAGRTDLILQRQKNKNPVLDIIDYKTNEVKGICYDSISRKDVVKHYNKFLLPPFEYLEDCNYVIYSLQLSIYALLAMETTGARIGKLAIIFFDNNLDGTYIPVPFMYQEAKMICENNMIVKKELPEANIKVSSSFDPNDITDDW